MRSQARRHHAPDDNTPALLFSAKGAGRETMRTSKTANSLEVKRQGRATLPQPWR
jgi:hypothetical protein